MSTAYEKVQKILSELDFVPEYEDAGEEILIISDGDRGISKMILDCEDPILVIEQFVIALPQDAGSEVYRRILQMNRDLVHGAFVLDESGEKLLYRDTLELENLDPNELEASINALSMALAENAGFFLNKRKQAEV
jgi:hypothetical protein